MEKLLNPNAARNVFNNGKEAHSFLTNGGKGGTHIISAGSMDFTNSNALALTNGAVLGGANIFMAGKEFTPAPNAAQMMKYADKELLTGKHIAGAEISDISPDLATDIVFAAEQQIKNNKIAEKMITNNQTIDR